MTEGLGDFFKLIAEDKKRKKDEFKELVGEIDINSIFSEVKEEIKKDKVNSEKVEKQALPLSLGCSLKQKKRRKRLLSRYRRILDEVQQEDVTLTREEDYRRRNFD